jgi:hypothetical protein
MFCFFQDWFLYCFRAVRMYEEILRIGSVPVPGVGYSCRKTNPETFGRKKTNPKFAGLLLAYL